MPENRIQVAVPLPQRGRVTDQKLRTSMSRASLRIRGEGEAGGEARAAPVVGVAFNAYAFEHPIYQWVRAEDCEELSQIFADLAARLRG